jgi:hypothetical protein
MRMGFAPGWHHRGSWRSWRCDRATWGQRAASRQRDLRRRESGKVRRRGSPERPWPEAVLGCSPRHRPAEENPKRALALHQRFRECWCGGPSGCSRHRTLVASRSSTPAPGNGTCTGTPTSAHRNATVSPCCSPTWTSTSSSTGHRSCSPGSAVSALTVFPPATRRSHPVG